MNTQDLIALAGATMRKYGVGLADSEVIATAIAAALSATPAKVEPIGYLHRDGNLHAVMPAWKADEHGSAEPDTSQVICPACCNQFRAIPQDVQRLMLDAGFEPPFTAPPAASAEGVTPVYWEYRWLDTANTPNRWSEWEICKPRNVHMNTAEDFKNEIQAYIDMGCRYELRALYTLPAPAASLREQRAEPQGLSDEEISSLYWATTSRYDPAANHIAVIIAFARAIAARASAGKDKP